jgi:hypothetical protein
VFQRLVESFSQCLVFCSKVSDFFLFCHAMSLPERSSLNTYGKPGCRKKLEANGEKERLLNANEKKREKDALRRKTTERVTRTL